MAGLIRREDVDAVRERARIEDVVGEHVTLKSAGVGSMKGLCPFHDERSPSFHVRPQVGRWHCFGCGEGGDVISFVQRIDGLAFAESVEYLAGRVGIQLRYEEGSGGPRTGPDGGTRRRLIDAHAVAAQFYAEQLATPAAAAGRGFLAERGFDRSHAEHFGVGFAPQGWDSLLRHLRGRGFTEAELVASGLMSQGSRGIYDRFRGRLVWPIREVTGDVVGFGARKLFDEDQGPKYLNTPETALYKKSQVLYGLDLAKREIAKARQVVVVEGYTDVMAAHLSGVPTAVATCGTAFGSEHARVVRRLLGDSAGAGGVQLASGTSVGGEIIFTFDGDAAGQKAAMRAFGEDQSFSAQTFVAVEPSGMDPCDLRQAKGPDAVQALVAGRQPLFEFVIRTTLAAHDLDTAEGRVGALRAAAPIVAGIRDAALRPEYARMLAGWLGMDAGSVRDAVAAAGRTSTDRSRGGQAPGRGRPDDGARQPGGHRPTGGRSDDGRRPGAPPPAESSLPAPDRRDPVANLERQALEVALQQPLLVPEDFDSLAADAFAVPAFRAVHEAIRAAGGMAAAREVAAGPTAAAAWVERVSEEAGAAVLPLVTELAVMPLPEDRPAAVETYVRGVVGALIDMGVTREIAAARGRLQRMDPAREPEAYEAAFAELIALEGRRRALRGQG
ncbi:DNA primase [Cellulomonas sp. ATA003]|uniref:DNA primase n=1 Tax=Cellulomonas sp. ATA003 TaxID=3073064 RepID=UPI00287342F1|nr:DNA primase [Cellulomonas sp. ATA003]WNB84574.1 DNA primase [Cellulomonas sp. ATA003]